MPFWGRLGEETKYKETKFSSKIMGDWLSAEYNIFGRVLLDMYIHMM